MAGIRQILERARDGPAHSIQAVREFAGDYTRCRGSRRYNIGRADMPSEYVEQRNGGYYVAGARVSLDSIVYAYRNGEAPETIHQNLPSLTLEQVYGAIAFYLGHQAVVDANIREGEEEFNRSVPSLSTTKPELYERLRRAREQLTKTL